jgi:CBS domain-containing protein
MKIRDIMTPEPRVCTPETTLAVAAGQMWDTDCGILPVVEDGALVRVLTDRDICIALATRPARAAAMKVGEVAARTVWTCGPDEDLHVALAAMKTHRVRRLPVVDARGHLVGVISLNDLVLAAGPDAPVRGDEVVDTLKAICAHHLPAPKAVAA